METFSTQVASGEVQKRTNVGMKRKEKSELSREAGRCGSGWRKSLGSWATRMKDKGEGKGWAERWHGQAL